MRDSGEVKGLTHFRRYNQNKLGELEGLKVHFSSISKSERSSFLKYQEPKFHLGILFTMALNQCLIWVQTFSSLCQITRKALPH